MRIAAAAGWRLRREAAGEHRRDLGKAGGAAPFADEQPVLSADELAELRQVRAAVRVRPFRKLFGAGPDDCILDVEHALRSRRQCALQEPSKVTRKQYALKA